MPNWSKSMQQSFEYYTVDPGTWRDATPLKNVKQCKISRDSEVQTLGSATIDMTNLTGEDYIRPYLITIQNGVREKFPLGTFLIQTPTMSLDGKKTDVSADAYTPLIELKENPPPIGYSIFKDENIMENAVRITKEHARAPVVNAVNDEVLSQDFIANTDDTWLSFLSDLAAKAKYLIGLDELGRIIFLPKQDTASLQPVWTYTDDNVDSIIMPEMTLTHDLYDVPNVVQVIYTNGSDSFHIEVVNDDENSPTSTVNRGRRVTYRDTNPSVTGNATRYQVEQYANQLLKQLSTIEYTITYKHGYCPVRLYDCVRLDLESAGLRNIKAKVISQNISCEPGCPVTETAVFTKELWG